MPEIVEKFSRDDVHRQHVLRWNGIEVARAPIPRDRGVNVLHPLRMQALKNIEARQDLLSALGPFIPPDTGVSNIVEWFRDNWRFWAHLAPYQKPENAETKKMATTSTDHTLLALQLMKGVRLFDVNFVTEYGNKGKKGYTYKSMEDLKPGDCVVVPTYADGKSFTVAYVAGESTDFDIEAFEYPPRWICFKIDDPMPVREKGELHDKKAKAKLARGKAKKAAADYLQAAGLDLSDFTQLPAPDADTIDAAVVEDAEDGKGYTDA